MDTLNSSQRNKVEQVIQFTSCSVSQAIRNLGQAKWDVSVASDNVFEEGVEYEQNDGSSDDDENALTPDDYKRLNPWFQSLKESDEDIIRGDGLLKLFAQIEVDAETDLVALILAMKMQAKEMFCCTREEFCRGMTALGVSNPETLKKILPELRKTLEIPIKFKELYTFTYSYALEPSQKVMTKSTALALWSLLFAGRFELLPAWLEFFEKNHKHGVSKDLWQQFYLFSQLSGISRGHYEKFDEICSWPLVLDEFVAHLRG